MEVYNGGNVPSGTILLWSGAVAAIPAGWLLCNGSNGTPDLRNRFILGAGGTYAVGATAGSVTHSHTGVTSEDATDSVSVQVTVPTVAVALETHVHSYNTGQTSTFPSYYALAWIMKA